MSCLPWNSSQPTRVTCVCREDKREVDEKQFVCFLLLSYIGDVFMSLFWGHFESHSPMKSVMYCMSLSYVLHFDVKERKF